MHSYTCLALLWSCLTCCCWRSPGLFLCQASSSVHPLPLPLPSLFLWQASSSAKPSALMTCRGGRHQAPAVQGHPPGVWLCSPGDHAGGLLPGSCLGGRQCHSIWPVRAHAAHRLLHWPHRGPHLCGHCSFWWPRLPRVTPTPAARMICCDGY